MLVQLLREIWEEAGLDHLKVKEYLGEYSYFIKQNKAEITRHYYHLTVQNHTKDIFTVQVKSDDEDNGWIYHYRWSDLKEPSKIELGGYLGKKLKALK